MERQVRKEMFPAPGRRERTFKELFRRLVWRLIRPLPDKPYLMLKYRLIKGVWPDIDHPKTFCEKVQARKLYDRNLLYVTLVDKARAKAFIAARVGERHVVPTYWTGTDLAAVDWEAVPLPAVVKPTHASGHGRFLHTREDVAELLRDDPGPAWLAIDHASYNREWAYGGVEPRIIVEAMLLVDGDVPWDYRLFTFDGVVSHIEVELNAGGEDYICTYSPDWVRLQVRDPDYLPAYPGDLARPAQLDEMLRIAGTIARGFDFLRVDLYAGRDWVRVGELTLYPDGGFERFDPPERDRILGDRWTLGFAIPGSAGRVRRARFRGRPKTLLTFLF